MTISRLRNIKIILILVFQVLKFLQKKLKSIVICGKQEASFLQKNIPKQTKQVHDRKLLNKAIYSLYGYWNYLHFNIMHFFIFDIHDNQSY